MLGTCADTTSRTFAHVSIVTCVVIDSHKLRNIHILTCARCGESIQDADLIVQASKDCVKRTLKRLEDKVTGKILTQLLCILRTSPEVTTRQYIATALAHLCNDQDRHLLFADNDPNGVPETLLQMVTYDKAPQQKEAALALFSLVTREVSPKAIDVALQPAAPLRAERTVRSMSDTA